MKSEQDKSGSAAADPSPGELRRRAEERLEAVIAAGGRQRAGDDALRLLHELQVHQIELELQNTELRQTRHDLEMALEKYTDLYELAPVGYLTLARDGTIAAANLSASTLLGVERSRLLGRRFEQRISKADRPAFSNFLRRVYDRGEKLSCELTLRREGEGALVVQIEAVAAASGQACRAAILDISERRQLEKHLEQLRLDQAARATELEFANVELEAFNYSVSHDLRNPLTAIHGYSQLLRSLCHDSLDEKCLEFIQEIYECSLQMDRLIDTLLDFSRLTHVEMHQGAVELSKMAQKVAAGLKATAPETRVEFRIAPDIQVDGDPDLLQVVLNNLLGNAWKYAGQRQGAVVEFGVTAVEGKPACFVRDNGPGFDPALADRLFLPFQRLAGSDVGGHGIGLATVDRIIRRHGGRVWAESDVGKGASFFFTLA